MKNLTLIIILTLFTQSTLSAQSCLPDGIIFDTQTQIDSFQINYPGCTQIEGDVTIQSFGFIISSLNGLNVLTSIGGDFIVINYSTTLTNFTGLDALTSIGGDFRITGGITSLTGLNLLTSIGGDFVILYEGGLSDFTGLDALASVGGDFRISNAHNITNLTGLVSLTSINGNLVIGSNFSLTSLSGLEVLTSIGGGLYMGANMRLKSLPGLEVLTSIGGDLSIYAHDSLTSIAELHNITSLGGRLRIEWNKSLTSLTGLDNIDPSTIDSLLIVFNDSLSTCEVQSICDYLVTPSSTIEIHDNAPGCNSQDEIEQACAVFVDELQPSEKLLIYPNPSSTQITIELTNTPRKNAFLTIYSINSQQQLKQQITEQKTVVDVSDLPNGFYFIKVTDNRTTVVSKLINN